MHVHVCMRVLVQWFVTQKWLAGECKLNRGIWTINRYINTFLLCYNSETSWEPPCLCMHLCACACMHVCVVAKRLSVQQTGGCQVAASPITGTELSCRCEQLLILLQCTLKEPRSQAKQQHPTWQHNSNHTPHSLWRKHTHTHVSQQTHVACQVFNAHANTR